jgi:hypothetical protein
MTGRDARFAEPGGQPRRDVCARADSILAYGRDTSCRLRARIAGGNFAGGEPGFWGAVGHTFLASRAAKLLLSRPRLAFEAPGR